MRFVQNTRNLAHGIYKVPEYNDNTYILGLEFGTIYALYTVGNLGATIYFSLSNEPESAAITALGTLLCAALTARNYFGIRNYYRSSQERYRNITESTPRTPDNP